MAFFEFASASSFPLFYLISTLFLSFIGIKLVFWSTASFPRSFNRVYIALMPAGLLANLALFFLLSSLSLGESLPPEVTGFLIPFISSFAIILVISYLLLRRFNFEKRVSIRLAVILGFLTNVITITMVASLMPGFFDMFCTCECPA